MFAGQISAKAGRNSFEAPTTTTHDFLARIYFSSFSCPHPTHPALFWFLAHVGHPLRAATHNAVPSFAAELTAMASDLPSAAQVAVDGVSSTLAAAMSTAMAEAGSREVSGWLGFFGWLLYVVFNLISTVLYWAVRIVTISIPRLLYALLSSSWTVTMNATTLYDCPYSSHMGLKFGMS